MANQEPESDDADDDLMGGRRDEGIASSIIDKLADKSPLLALFLAANSAVERPDDSTYVIKLGNGDTITYKKA